MKSLFTNGTLVLSIFAAFLFFPFGADAQMPMGGGMGMRGGMGMGPYGGFPGYGMGGMGGMEGGNNATVYVKYGEKIFDAVFGDLIEAHISYIQVPPDAIGQYYFDDGTHGDEIPYDGMPSDIIINDNTYLGPFAIKYKKVLQNAYEAAKNMGALQFFQLGVVTKDDDSQVTKLSEWEKNLTTFLDDRIVSRLDQFKGFDDQTYVKAIDPSLFESMEGMGGMTGGGFGPGTMMADLPAPPGLPNVQDMQFGGQNNQQQRGDVAQPAPPKQTQEQPQRFNPIQRATDAAGSLEATEGMNTLNR